VVPLPWLQADLPSTWAPAWLTSHFFSACDELMSIAHPFWGKGRAVAGEPAKRGDFMATGSSPRPDPKSTSALQGRHGDTGTKLSLTRAYLGGGSGAASRGIWILRTPRHSAVGRVGASGCHCQIAICKTGGARPTNGSRRFASKFADLPTEARPNPRSPPEITTRTRNFDASMGCLNVSPPARPSGLSLAWTRRPGHLHCIWWGDFNLPPGRGGEHDSSLADQACGSGARRLQGLGLGQRRLLTVSSEIIRAANDGATLQLPSALPRSAVLGASREDYRRGSVLRVG
jgi:hypothetical protein